MRDGRLLVPAAAAWAGAWAGTALSGAWSLGLGLIACLGVAACVVLLLRVRSGAGRWAIALVAGLALAAGLASAGLRADAWAAEPVAGWAQSRATAIVEGVIVAEPVLRTFADSAPWQSASVLEVALATTRLTARGRTVDVDLPLVVRLAVDQAVPPPGSIVRVSGRLSRRPGPIPAVMLAARSAPVVLAAPGPVDAVAQAMRDGLRSAVTPLDPDAGALVAGLAVGDESGQSAELDAAMRDSGLAHLTAVSGGNVAIVVATVVGAATLVGLSLASRVLLALAALGFFVVLVGYQPSVLRAAAMGVVVLAALLAGGRRPGPSVLATAVVVLVLVHPGLATSWAFALSVMATGALILLAPVLADRLASWPPTRRWPPILRTALAVTLAAQAGTAPVLLLMGASIGWVAVPANLLAMPAVPAVTVLGLAAAIASPMLPAVAEVLALVASVPAGWIAAVAFRASAISGGMLPIPTGPGGVGLIALALIVVLALRWSRRRDPAPSGPLPRSLRGLAVAAALLIAGLWLVLPPARRAWPPDGWLLILCDVGQGDAVLLRAGPGAAVVVDVGPHPDRVDRCLDDAGVAVVPALLLTHFHADHVGGLPGVLRGRSVGQVLVTPVRDPAEQALDVDGWLGRAGLVATPISAGDRRGVGDVDWQALWPRRVIDAGSVPNNASVVLEVTVAGRSVLLTGDIEQEAQAALAASLDGTGYDVVKVPHHGSPNQADLPAWAPAALALVSVGQDNPYGHPAPSTLDAWQESGARVLRTDRDGDIAVVPVGEGVGAVTRG